MVSRATKSVRSWFSPEQACQYLAQQLNIEVILNDLEELIDNQQIQLYVRDCSFTGFVLIELKDKRYRITIRDIKAVYSFTNGLAHKGDEFNVKDYAVSSKGIFKKSFLKSAAPLLNYDFTTMFTINNLNDDW